MKKTAIFLIAAALFTQTCYADSIDSVKYDRVSQKIKVTGSYDDINIFRPMFVMKVEDGEGKLNLMTQYENAETEGKFSFEMPVEGESGEYTVTVNSNALKKALSVDFDYYSSNDIAEIIKVLNKQTEEEEFKKKINENFSALGINSELNEKLSNAGTVYSDMYKEAPFDDIEKFLNSYYKNAVSLLIYENKDSKYSVQMLDEHEKEAGITDEAAYEDYKNMTSAEKETVVSKIAGLKEEDDFEKSFNEAVVLALVKNSNSYGETGNILKKYKDIVYRNDISSYFSKTDPQAINLALTGNDYKNIKEMQDVILSKLKTPSQNGGNGSSGGSSGGSSSGIPAPSGNGNISGTTQTNTVYTDIDDVEWAKNAIYALSEKGILNGVGEGLFAPNENVKREEFVKILVEAFNIDTNVAADVKFADVEAGAWYEKYINAGVKTGAVKGIGNNMFGVGMTITRQDMAVMAYRFAKSAGTEFNNSSNIDNFSDRAAIADYAEQAISALCSEAVLTGMSDSRFEPQSTATRAQAAVMVYRLLQFTEGGQK